jgi:hypothetical protein
MAQSQPGWITRLAAIAVLMVIGLPIFLLVMFAFLVGGIVFAFLALTNALVVKVKGVLPRRDGRENVRVIHRTP